MQIIKLFLTCFFLSFYQTNYKLYAVRTTSPGTSIIATPIQMNPPTTTPIIPAPTTTPIKTTETPSAAPITPTTVTTQTSVTAPTVPTSTPMSTPTPIETPATEISPTPTLAEIDTAPLPLSAPTFIAATPVNTVTPAPTNPTPTAPTNIPTSAATTPTNTQNLPAAPAPIEQFLTSIYIQNNFPKEGILNQIDLLVDNQKTPLIKSNLNITIPAVKNLYSKGSIIGFDITSPGKNINNFNGIASITISNDKISFTHIKTGYGIDHPIKITQKNGHWIEDKM